MPELTPGQRFGAYTLAEPLGEGPGGWWWRVSRGGRPDRAMLILPKVGSAAMARLQRVAQLHQVVENPAIIPVLDIVEADDAVGVLSQWSQGPVLEDWMGHNTMAPARSESWFRLLVEGVQQAHGVGLVHLDLSPSRVVVARGEDGKVRPRIVGFGIWAALENEPMVLEERMPAEQAPEQVRGEAASRSTDIFFLGELFYVLLSGQHPFGDPDPARAQQKLLSGTVIPIRRLRPSATPVQDDLISSLLRPEPAQRLPDCQAIFDVLDGNVATAADLMPKPTAEELADWDDFMAEAPQSNTTFRRAKAHQIVEFDEESTPIRPVPPTPRRATAGTAVPSARRPRARAATLVPRELSEEEIVPVGLFDTVDPPPQRSVPPAPRHEPPRRQTPPPARSSVYPPTIDASAPPAVSQPSPVSTKRRPSLARPMPSLAAPRPSLSSPSTGQSPPRRPSSFHEDPTEPPSLQPPDRRPRDAAPFVSLTPRDEISSPLLVAPSLPPAAPREPLPDRHWQTGREEAGLMVSLDHNADDRPRLPTPTPAPPPPKGPSKLRLQIRLALVAVIAALLVLLAGFIGIRLVVPEMRARMAQQAATPPEAPQEVVTIAQTPSEPAPPSTGPEGTDVEQPPTEVATEPTAVAEAPPTAEPESAVPTTRASTTRAPLTIAERSRRDPDQDEPEWAPSDPNYDPARPPTTIVRNEQTGRPERPEPTLRQSEAATQTTETPDPPPPPPPSMVQVQFAPGPEDAWLEAGRKRYRSGDVPEGIYDIKAVFDGDEVLAGRADLQGAESVTVRCSAGFQRCRIAP